MKRKVRVTNKVRKRVRVPPMLKNLCFLSAKVTAASWQFSVKKLLVKVPATGEPRFNLA